MSEMGFDAEAVKALAERSGEPGWLTDRRLEALARFEVLPWPDQSLEEWRHTDLRRFTLAGLTPTPAAHTRADSLDGVPPEVLAAMGTVRERDGLAIQVDADVVHVSLARGLAERGVIFAPLAEAAAAHPELVRDALGSGGVAPSEEKVATLAAAFASGGTFLYVPRGVDVPLPIQSFRWLSAQGVAAFPPVVVVAEEASSVTYIDHFHGTDLGGPALNAAVVEIYARPGANVTYLSVQDWPQTVWHFQMQRAILERDANVLSLSAAIGAAFSRSVVESILQGAGAHSDMLGVYMGGGDQHFSTWSLQDHRAPNTTSGLNFKGALKGHSHAVYRGLIRLRKGADKTDAYQLNRNLLLSDHARADPAPFLEIEANDVKCSHGTSVGPPSKEQIFYAQSRGLSPAQAERLIVKGFFQEVLDKVRVAEIRETLEAAVEAELDLEE